MFSLKLLFERKFELYTVFENPYCCFKVQSFVCRLAVIDSIHVPSRWCYSLVTPSHITIRLMTTGTGADRAALFSDSRLSPTRLTEAVHVDLTQFITCSHGYWIVVVTFVMEFSCAKELNAVALKLSDKCSITFLSNNYSLFPRKSMT